MTIPLLLGGFKLPKENIKKIVEALENYIISNNRIEPFVFLYGEEKNEGNIAKIKDLSISSPESQKELIKIIQVYCNKVNAYIEGENNFQNLNDNSDSGLFFKIMDQNDLNKTKRLLTTVDTAEDFTDFLKSKFKNSFFITEINLDQSDDKKIILLKSVGQTFYAKKNRFTISPYSERQKIKFIDNKKELLLDEKFEITAFINNSQCFFFITDRKKFEDLYGYHEIYKNAYDNLAESLDFIDWSNAQPTISLIRNCYTIANFVRLDECVSKLKAELTSINDNSIKIALKSKGIEYMVEDGNVQLFPQNTPELKALLKIIKDGVAKTCLLDRNVLGSDFEELE